MHFKSRAYPRALNIKWNLQTLLGFQKVETSNPTVPTSLIPTLTLTVIRLYTGHVYFEGDDRNCPGGSLKTLPEHVREYRVISGSCDNAKNRGDVDMWDQILRYVEEDKVDLLVHNGDQVYADSAFKKTEVCPTLYHPSPNPKHLTLTPNRGAC